MSENMDDQTAGDDRYRRLVDAITDYAIYMLDSEGRIASWNAGAQRFKGYEAAEIIGQHFSRFYTPEDLAAGLPAQALRTAAENGSFECEGWRVRKDGIRFWAHVVIDAIRDPDGTLAGYAKITRDLTERHTGQLALRRSEQQFRALVDAITDYAIYMLDPEGRVASWNAGAQRFKGYEAEEILGQHFSNFYTPEDRVAGLPRLALDIAAREGRFEKEGWRVRKDGTRFWAHVVIDPIREHGRLVGFAKVTRDITERRETQKALEQAQQALFQSQKLDSIGQLTGGVAHDFNNLLTAILGSLELLRKRLPDDPKGRMLIDNALQGAQRGASLTQRMLAFARRQELRPELVDVPTLVEGMRGLFEGSVGPGVSIDNRFQISLPCVRVDANQLETALLNLVVNARDAMPDGGVIVIDAAQHDLADGNTIGAEPGRYVRLSVTDTGEGMDEATLRQAMEPFFTTKGIGKGTGLGLSMVHGLAEQSGGKLRLISKPGAGATVEIWLRASEDKAAPHAPPTAPAKPAGRPSLTILVVDDDHLVRVNAVAMLEDLGHTVLEAESGLRALEILAQDRQVDVVVTDQAMPGMTGLQLAARVKASRPNLPVLLATGYAEQPSRTDPAMPRLAKPFTQAELADAIHATCAAVSAGAPRDQETV